MRCDLEVNRPGASLAPSRLWVLIVPSVSSDLRAMRRVSLSIGTSSSTVASFPWLLAEVLSLPRLLLLLGSSANSS